MKPSVTVNTAQRYLLVLECISN